MRALHVYSGNLYGGAERFLLTLAQAPDACPGLESSFALCFKDRLYDELAACDAKVHLLGNVRFSRPWTLLRARARAARLLREIPTDVVICYGAWPHAVFAPTIRAAGKKLVFWNLDLPTGKHWLERWAGLTRPDLVIANSRLTQSAAAKLFKDAPCALLHVPIPDPSIGGRKDFRSHLRRELKTPDDAVVILMAGRLQAWKGHVPMITALGQLKELPHWRCWITGSPQRQSEEAYFTELQELTQRLGLSGRVQFLGHRPDINAVFQASDIYCQPNIAPEPFGLSFIEALYCGLPVVATALGGALEIVNDGCGILVPAGNAQALTESLARLITSPALRASLGAEGRVRARKLCDLKTQLERLSDMLTHTRDA